MATDIEYSMNQQQNHPKQKYKYNNILLLDIKKKNSK